MTDAPPLDKVIRRGRRSTVASHPDLPQLELGLANGVALKSLSQRYGISTYALRRYLAAMDPRRLAALRYRLADPAIDMEALKAHESQSLIQRSSWMLAELERVWRVAADAGDLNTASRIAAQHARYLELQARLLGDLVTGNQHIHLQVVDSLPYKKLVSRLMAWFSGRPEAPELADFLQQIAEDERGPLLEAQPVAEAADAAE